MALVLAYGCASSDRILELHPLGTGGVVPIAEGSGGAEAGASGGAGTEAAGGTNSEASGGQAGRRGDGSGGGAVETSCNRDTDCQSPTPRCNRDANLCVECLFHDECGQGRFCDRANDFFRCVDCLGDADCGAGQSCDTMYKVCVDNERPA